MVNCSCSRMPWLYQDALSFSSYTYICQSMLIWFLCCSFQPSISVRVNEVLLFQPFFIYIWNFIFVCMYICYCEACRIVGFIMVFLNILNVNYSLPPLLLFILSCYPIKPVPLFFFYPTSESVSSNNPFP